MGMDLRGLPEDWKDKSLTSIIAHIVETHHVFCRQEVARLASLFKEVIDRHGKEHPELKGIQSLFFKMSRDLSMHLVKEEQTLFPYIARVEEAFAQKSQVSWPPFGTVENPIRMMVLEHDQTDKELDEIRKLTKEYVPPAGASDRYISLFDGLAAFDRDMQCHIHFEDNLLFPRAVAMEEEACSRQKARS